jgi:NAD(P)-dependent dehydrogenase (short-subunit alcohol dehydrogenase family)
MYRACAGVCPASGSVPESYLGLMMEHAPTIETDLAGTVALVTGASSGIGSATAAALAHGGAAVALAARRKDRLESLAARIVDQGGTALALKSDITDERQATEAVERTVSDLGRLDILINNAGSCCWARRQRHRWRITLKFRIMSPASKVLRSGASTAGRPSW